MATIHLLPMPVHQRSRWRPIDPPVRIHGKPVQLHLEKLWDRNIGITTRLVDTAALKVIPTNPARQ